MLCRLPANVPFNSRGYSEEAEMRVVWQATHRILGRIGRLNDN